MEELESTSFPESGLSVPIQGFHNKNPLAAMQGKVLEMPPNPQDKQSPRQMITMTIATASFKDQ